VQLLVRPGHFFTLLVAFDWVSTFGGMEWWNGIVEWNSGMGYWNGGMLHWTYLIIQYVLYSEK